MNYSLAVLWCIFLILGMYLIFLIIHMWIGTIKNQPQIVILPSSENQCGDVSSLPDFSSLQPCSSTFIQYRGARWYPKMNFIVSSVEVSYLNVCETACGPGGLTSFGTCNDTTLQPDYDKCVLSLVPKGCNSLANPVGKIGDVLYYANYVGEGLCFSKS